MRVRIIADWYYAPWVRVFVGPRLWSATDAESSDLSDSRSFLPLSGGGLAYETGGVACGRPYMTDGKPEIIALSFWRSQADTLKTLRHELWHVLEYHLHPDDLAAVDAMAEGGRHYPTWYMHSPVERRARLFEAWATARAEGWIAPHLHGTCLTHVDRVFHYVLSGGLALDVMAKRPARSHDIPLGKVARKLRAAYDEVGWQGMLAATMGIAFLLHR